MIFVDTGAWFALFVPDDRDHEVLGNFTGGGDSIHVVFGAPVDFGDLLDAPHSPRVYKRVSERCIEEITKLGQEERVHRANDDRGSRR